MAKEDIFSPKQDTSFFDRSLSPSPGYATPEFDKGLDFADADLGGIDGNGGDAGLNSAQLQGITSGVSSAADLTTQIVGGVLQNREISRAQEQAKSLAEMKRGDVKETQNIQNQLRARAIDQDAKRQQISERAYSINRQFNRFKLALQDSVKAESEKQYAAQGLSGAFKKNPNLVEFIKRYVG